MSEFIAILLTFLLILLLYELFVIRKTKRRVKKKREVSEYLYLKYRYKDLDIDKINKSRLLQVICFVSSFDITVVVTIVYHIHNYFLAIISALVLLVLMIVVSYHLVYLYYKKKGFVKDEWYFKNRKEMAKVLGWS